MPADFVEMAVLLCAVVQAFCMTTVNSDVYYSAAAPPNRIYRGNYARYKGELLCGDAISGDTTHATGHRDYWRISETTTFKTTLVDFDACNGETKFDAAMSIWKCRQIDTYINESTQTRECNMSSAVLTAMAFQDNGCDDDYGAPKMTLENTGSCYFYQENVYFFQIGLYVFVCLC